MRRVVLVSLWLALCASGTGCSLAPRSFRDMLHPAPIVRARAVGLDDQQPEWVAVPAMIARLDDPAPVVRMTANDGLKERTRRDFGFVPWASAEERAPAVERWRAWWEDRRAQAGYPSPEESRKVAARAGRRRKTADPDVQGGTTPSWPANPPTPASASASMAAIPSPPS